MPYLDHTLAVYHLARAWSALYDQKMLARKLLNRRVKAMEAESKTDPAVLATAVELRVATDKAIADINMRYAVLRHQVPSLAYKKAEGAPAAE